MNIEKRIQKIEIQLKPFYGTYGLSEDMSSYSIDDLLSVILDDMPKYDLEDWSPEELVDFCMGRGHSKPKMLAG